MQKLVRAMLIALLILLAGCTAGVKPSAESPRNIIFLLGDGMGFAQVKAYRMYADDPATELVDPLPMDELQVGSVSTDSIRLECHSGACIPDPYGFTDSASSATAYATGADTLVGRLSLTPGEETMTTLFEVARRHGKSTGLAVTSEITHASPAAFCSHVADREQYTDIADQYFDNRWNGKPMVDVMLGGGLSHLQREDRDLVSEFRQEGYQIAFNREELLAADGEKLLGLFANEGLPRAWDRPEEVPSLAEMTRAALDALKGNPNGFFLFVEGSQVDWASHDNSVVGVVSEMEDFIAAVRVALDFAEQDGDTLVIMTADHETGGMSLGRDDIYRWDPRPLRGVTATPAAMTAPYLASEQALSAIVAAQVPFELSKHETERLDAAAREELEALAAITELFDKRSLTGWSSPGHTGVDVPLYVTGPGSEYFGGVMQNEAIGQALLQIISRN